MLYAFRTFRRITPFVHYGSGILVVCLGWWLVSFGSDRARREYAARNASKNGNRPMTVAKKAHGAALVEFGLLILLIAFVYLIIQSTTFSAADARRICAEQPERCTRIEWSVK